MEKTFRDSFLKVAFIPTAARFGSKLVSKGFGSVVRGAKNLATSAKTNPLGTAGKVGAGGLIGMEVANVGSKVKGHMENLPRGTSMKDPSFFTRGPA